VTGRLLTAREVADLLGVSTETVLRWTREGRLSAFRLSNRATRFREVDIEAWLAERATPGRGSANHPEHDAARAAAYGNPTRLGLGLAVPTTPEDEDD
jgi:excisionase family DNA binding protein